MIRYRTYQLGVMSFGSSAEKKKKQMIRYRNYQPGSDEFRIISREKENASDKISDLSARK